MKQIFKTVGKIMEEIRALTGWTYVGAMKGNICYTNITLTNNEGKDLQILMEINGKDVQIKITALDGTVAKEDVEHTVEKLDFPVEIEYQEGTSFSLIHHEPLGVLEYNVKGVLRECIIPMADAASQAMSA
ncbi:hypothetical protein AALC25_08335 [Lachnospiraceae bacterium 29-84]